ncbi:efflux RND transporter periplasmic adaptor subunit [Geobacter sp. SVR]|uniref:efflux RND transporter periplasmic adaptor subunit n=1 Tax=Geobacter sp. SVR TaxID=2495594 RepID=UPI00143EFF23|nr:efflux RND transporter periplasmic adaptor subunit [Geobacter sp. SVR]BCS52360.1 RND transporter [Geobacter sp. SVR]GCF84981.1 RND transporter [Geobacter sp. SVR]
MKKVLLIVVPILLVAGVAGFTYFKRAPEITYKTARIERGPIVSTVSATGNLSAVTTVQVGTQVSGTIHRIYVDYNSHVREGQTIAEIDPSLFRAAVEQSQGNFLNAEANLQKAKVTQADTERTFNRSKKLLEEGIISQGDYDVSEAAFQSARAAVKAAEGSVAQTRGALMQSRTNLNYAIIRSPVNGVVISRAVDVGQTVAASFQTPTLFTIAKDLTKMQIEVSVDESDISRIKLDQSASFTVDAYPEQSFKGKVVQIRNAPVVSQNVVTYVVVVNVDNDDLKLKPGMTANVSIQVDRNDDALKLPPAALRFKPKGEEPSAKRSGPADKARPGRKEERGQQVYLLKEGKPAAVTIKTGIGNNTAIEVTEGALKEGDEVIVEQLGGDSAKKKQGMGPGMGRPF